MEIHRASPQRLRPQHKVLGQNGVHVLLGNGFYPTSAHCNLRIKQLGLYLYGMSLT